MATFFKILMTINSLLLAGMIFLVKEQFCINYLMNFPYYISYLVYLVYFLIVILFSWLSLCCTKYLDTDEIEEGAFIGIEPANDVFLPSYLGYFFVALSVPNLEMFIVVFLIIAIFIFYSRASYFNPVFFIFGYHFFFIKKNNGVKILVIVKRKKMWPLQKILL
jgi:hypothetical protein